MKKTNSVPAQTSLSSYNSHIKIRRNVYSFQKKYKEHAKLKEREKVILTKAVIGKEVKVEPLSVKMIKLHEKKENVEG